MRSAVSHEFVNCPAESLVVQLCRTSLAMLFDSIRMGFDSFTGLASKLNTAAYAKFSDDSFDWRLNELVYKDNIPGSLPPRAWQRHSAVLMLARQSSMTTSPVAADNKCGLMAECSCEDMHCRVNEISCLPIWSTNFSDMGIIYSENNL